MTSPNSTDRIASPVQVEVKNWAESAKPPVVRNTTLKTWVIDPAGAAGPAQVQIAAEEPTRLRMAIIVSDQPVALCKEKPSVTPDTNTVSTAPEGAYLAVTPRPYEFFGPDAFWLNAVGTVGRVTVIKEYC